MLEMVVIFLLEYLHVASRPTRWQADSDRVLSCNGRLIYNLFYYLRQKPKTLFFEVGMGRLSR